MSTIVRQPPEGGCRHPRLRPQRGRLRGAGRPARGERLGAGRRSRGRRRRRSSTPAASSRRPRRTRSTRCSPVADLKESGGPKAVVAVGCLAERYGTRAGRALPEADAVLGFDDYPDIGAKLRRIVAGEQHVPHTPTDRRHAAADLAGRPAGRRGRGPRPCVRRRRTTTFPAGSRRSCAAGSTAARSPRQAGLRLRPPLRVLRDPVLPRLLRLAAARSDVLAEVAVAGRPGRARGRAGQRELHVVRQGPRRPAPAGGAAAAARDGDRHRAGPGGVPAAGRDAARPARGDRDDARRGALLRPVLPAREPHACCAGCAASAAARSSSTCVDRIREPGPGGRDPQQRHRRLPRRDRGGLRRAARVPEQARLDAVGVFGYCDEDGTEAATLPARSTRTSSAPGSSR